MCYCFFRLRTQTPITKPPTSNPTLEPTLEPTSNPTPNPTFEPTLQPSLRPTDPETLISAKPTCPVDSEFNICIAIDMSGSVCNNGDGLLCPMCGDRCNTFGFDMATCCSNFFDMKEFVSSIVTSVAELPIKKSFSLVRVATDAVIVRSLGNSKKMLSALDGLEYTGGKTNLAGGITSCQESFATSTDRKNLILVISDGVPTVPDNRAEEAAEAAATNAKNQGSFVIPVLISSMLESDDALSVMKMISSDQNVFDVESFDALDSLQESLLEQVYCQA